MSAASPTPRPPPGATIHTATPVRALRRDGTRWVIDAGTDGLTADAVVIATNAYTGDLFPGLRDSIIPMRGHGFVTRAAVGQCPPLHPAASASR